jgi:hypothetical protein
MRAFSRECQKPAILYTTEIKLAPDKGRNRIGQKFLDGSSLNNGFGIV